MTHVAEHVSIQKDPVMISIGFQEIETKIQTVFQEIDIANMVAVIQ